ncbi:MAG: hypothetical protein J7L96_02615 [Bacteroidales bacterium]|nr:hypothetical protein [Bacteroidales bacterium]
MKALVFRVLATAVFPACLLGCLIGCSDDIQLVYPGESTPVIYCIFDCSDSLHSIKITKSFAGEEGIADMMADPANLYYESPAIKLRYNATQLAMLFTESPSTRIDGIFPEHPNPIYTLKRILPAGGYTIAIELPGVEQAVIAQTELFNDLRVVYPNKKSKRIYFYDDPLSFTWFPSEHAASYEIAFQLKIEEVNENGDKSIRQVQYSRQIFDNELLWKKDRYQYQIFSDPVFAYWGRTISKNKSVSYRKPIELTASITAADEDLTRYIKYMHPGSDIKKDPKGNIEGAIGIIASKYTVKFSNLKLSPKAMDSLRSGRFTKTLKFVSNSDW